jgi:hypothetical protein
LIGSVRALGALGLILSVLAVAPAAGQEANPRAFASRPDDPDVERAQPPAPLYLFQDGPLDPEALRRRLDSPDFVVLRGSEYDRLRRAAAGPKPGGEPSAPATVVESVVVTGTLGPERARLRCLLGINQREPGVTWAPIGLDGAVLRRVSEGDRDLPARAGPAGAWEVQLDGNGRHAVAVELVAPVQSDVGGERLTLAIPPAASTRIDLTTPGPVEEAEVVPGLALVPEPAEASPGTRLRASVPARSRLEVRWRSRASAEGTSPAMLSARGEIAADVDRGALRLRSLWSITCDRGATAELAIRVPDAQDELLELQVDDQPVAVEGRFDTRTRVVSVPLATPLRAGESRQVRLLTRRSLPAAATTRVEVEGFPIVGATAQSGVLAITQAADLWVSGNAGRGLRQIDPRELPEALRSRPSTVLAYAFIEQPFRLSLRVDPSPPSVQVATAATVAVVPGEARITARLDYRLTRGRVQEVRIGLPPGFVPDEVGPADVVEAQQVLDEPSGERTLLVRLSPRAPGTTGFRLDLAGRQPLADSGGATAVGLPRPRDATSLGTRVALVVARELAATLPDEGGESGFTLLATDGPPTWDWPGGRRPGEPVVWLAHTGSPAGLPLAIGRRERVVRAQVTLQATVDRRGLDLRQTLAFQVRNGVVTSLELAVPAALEGRWEVEGGEIAARDRLDDGRGPLVRYRLTLGGAVADALALRLRTRVPVAGLAADRPTRLELPWIGLPGVEAEPVRVEVGSDAGVRLAAVGAGWSAVPEAERGLPRADGAPAPRLVWQGPADSPTFPAVEATAPQAYALPETLVSRLWLRTIAPGRGDRQVAAWYRVEAHRGEIAVKLPPGARLLQARVGGAPREPQAGGPAGVLRLAIPEAPGTATTVSLQYAQAAPAGWEAPELLGGVVQQTLHEVRLPWSRALLGVPAGWVDENEWYWDRYVWKRRPTRDGAALGAWVGAPPRLVDPRDDVAAGYHGYLFGRDGGPAGFAPRVLSRAALVGGCSGIVLLVGMVLLLNRASGRLVRALALSAALAAGATLDATSLLQAAQSGAVGLLLLAVAALTQRLVERRPYGGGPSSRGAASATAGASGMAPAGPAGLGGGASNPSGTALEGSTVIRPRTSSTTIDFVPLGDRAAGEGTP